MIQRLGGRGWADPEVTGEITNGGRPIAWLELAGPDLIFEHASDDRARRRSSHSFHKCSWRVTRLLRARRARCVIQSARERLRRLSCDASNGYQAAAEAVVSTPRASGEPLRLALSRNDAAAALGMSLRHFQRHVQPNLRCIYSGQLRLYPVAELERWIKEQGWRNGAGA